MKKFIFNRQRLSLQQGFTLIEILVTMIVMSVGLLGYAGLLTVSVKNNNSAYYRSQATIFADDIIERIRLNRALAASFNIAIGSVPVAGTVPGNELADWKTNISRSLPAGDGSVAIDLNGNITIVIQWDDSGNGTPTTFSTQSLI